jgi:protoheme ferro-lyase
MVLQTNADLISIYGFQYCSAGTKLAVSQGAKATFENLPKIPFAFIVIFSDHPEYIQKQAEECAENKIDHTKSNTLVLTYS